MVYTQAAVGGTITASMYQEHAVELRRYMWANSSARTLQTGMVTGEFGYQVDTGKDYRYDGTSWVEQDTGWQTPALANSWTSVAGQTIQYRRVDGIVYLRGRATGGTTGTIFTLPADCRPTQSFVVAVGDGTATTITVTRIVVNDNGTVTGVSGTLPNLVNVPPFPVN